MKTILEVKNLTFKYTDSDLFTLKDISFELNESESMGILGPNGGGKTTLMKILSGLLPLSSGKYSILDKDVTDTKNFPHHLISYVPQSQTINTILPIKAIDFLMYAAKALKIENAKEKIQIQAKYVGIENKLDYQFKDMSGGEKQRVLICKALLNSPKILLLDEPTKGLDSVGQDQLLSILKEIRKINKTAVVIVDHNINQIIRHCDKVLCLNRTSHWHDHKQLLTKTVLENIYHCEFEHLLIHESEKGQQSDDFLNHHFCEHDSIEHEHIYNKTSLNKHLYIRRKK